MKILILGDVMGSSGRKAINQKLPGIIKNYKIDFVIINGENAADDGRGITKNIAEEFFENGVDVITSGNHIWDKQETTNFIEVEKWWVKNIFRVKAFFRSKTFLGSKIFSAQVFWVKNLFWVKTKFSSNTSLG